MVGPDVAGGRVGGLHGERAVGPVEGERQPLGLHRKKAQLVAGYRLAVLCSKSPAASPSSASIPFPACRVNSVSPCGEPVDEVRAAPSFPQVRSSPSISSRSGSPAGGTPSERRSWRHRDRVDAVVVAVPVGLHDELGIPDVRGSSRNRRPFRIRGRPPKPGCPFSRRRSSVTQPPLVQLQVAAGKAAVHAPVVEEVVGVEFAADLVAPAGPTQLVVVTGRDWYSSLFIKVMSPADPLRYILSDCGSTSLTISPSLAPARFTFSQSAAP